MSKNHIISIIQSRPWLIQESYAHSFAPLMAKLIAGEPVFGAYHDDSDDDHDTDRPDMKSGNFTVTREGAVAFGNKYNPFLNAQPGSTAVISMNGPIMKYDNCGDPGTRTYGNLLNMANANPNINSILLMIDSPGGTVDGTVDLANAVRKSEKPVVAFVDGLMASAAYWVGSGADKVIANNETADIGSIGTMLRFIDVQPMWEKEGVKFHSVYADASSEKNKDFHDLQAGKYDSVKEDLNAINDRFIAAVKESRPNIKESALKGKMFLAQEAITQGLIDEIGSFDYAVEVAQELSRTAAEKERQTSKNSQQTNMKKVTLTAAHAALLAVCGVSIAAGQDSVEVDIDALNAGVSKLSNDMKSAQDAVATSKTELDAAVAAKATAEKELADFKASNPGSTTTSTDKDDKIDASESADDYSSDIDAELAAKRKALGY